MSNKKWNMGEIFVAFSEYLNFNLAFPYLFQCHVEIWPFDKGRRLGQRRVPCVRVCDPWPTRSKWSLPSIGECLNLVTSPVKLKFGFSSQFFSKSNTVDITEAAWAQFLKWIFNFGPNGQLRAVREKNWMMNYWLLLWVNFSYFHGQKKVNLFLDIRTKKLDNLKMKKYIYILYID